MPWCPKARLVLPETVFGMHLWRLAGAVKLLTFQTLRQDLKSLLASINNFKSQSVSLTLSLIRHPGNITAEITQCVSTNVAFSRRRRCQLAARLPPALAFLLCALTFPTGIPRFTPGSGGGVRKIIKKLMKKTTNLVDLQ